MVLNEEDVAVNNIGAGNIAGAGIGPQGEPGVPVKKRRLADHLKRTYKGFKEFTNAKQRAKH
jgi:hypothetical protein